MPLSPEDRLLLQQTNDSVQLLSSTGNALIDDMVKGCIGIMERTFPGRIESYYIRGSYANGHAVATSDVDLECFFKGDFQEGERSRARQIGWLLDKISPLDLGVGSRIEPNVTFKLDSMLMYGKDLSDRMKLPPFEKYKRNTMWTQMMYEARVWHLETYLLDYPERGDDREEQRIKQYDALVYPVDYPDPEGEFYGYNTRRMDSLSGPQGLGTKDLINLLFELIIPLVAQKTGEYVPNKTEGFARYKKHINDEWADFLMDVWETCRQQWQYCTPEDQASREKLRALCEKVLAFENYYLERYRELWLKELGEKERGRLVTALYRFNDVVFPDDEVLEAVSAFTHSEDEKLRSLAESSVEKIKRAQKI